MGWARDLSSTTTDLLNRLQNEDAHQLEYWELDPVVSLGKAAVTVATVDSDLSLQFPKLTPSMAKEATRLAVLHQQHHCSSLCKVSLFPGQDCNKFFPRLPSLLCLVARTPLLNKEGQSKMANIYAIHVRLQRYLRGLSSSPEHNQVASLLSLLKKVADPPEVLPSNKGFTWGGVIFPYGPLMQYMFNQCQQYGRTPGDVALLQVYHMSLLTRRHAKYIPKRSVAEAYIVNYNPMILLATHSNMELDLITHTPHVWFSYLTKSGKCQASLKSSQRDLQSRGEQDHAERLAKIAEDKKREVTLGEAFFLIDPSLSLASTNATVRFVMTGHHSLGVEAAGVLKRPDQTMVVYYSLR